MKMVWRVVWMRVAREARKAIRCSSSYENREMNHN